MVTADRLGISMQWQLHECFSVRLVHVHDIKCVFIDKQRQQWADSPLAAKVIPSAQLSSGVVEALEQRSACGLQTERQLVLSLRLDRLCPRQINYTLNSLVYIIYAFLQTSLLVRALCTQQTTLCKKRHQAVLVPN